VSPEPPHTTVQTFCVDKLREFDCQILSHIRNYIFYSYGVCANQSDMYMQTFTNPACSQVKDLIEYNTKMYDAIPNKVWTFVGTIRKLEIEKGCRLNNLDINYR